MMYYVYILINRERNRTYVGCTSNLDKRIEEHNKGLVKSSRAYRPYRLLYKEEFLTLRDARAKEDYYKGTSGRRKLKELLVADRYCACSSIG